MYWRSSAKWRKCRPSNLARPSTPSAEKFVGSSSGLGLSDFEKRTEISIPRHWMPRKFPGKPPYGSGKTTAGLVA